MRHRILAIGAFAALVPAGAALAAAPDTTTPDTVPSDTTPSDTGSETTPETLPQTTVGNGDDGSSGSAPQTTSGSGTDGSTAVSTVPAEPAPVVIFDGDRNPVAMVTATSAELSWTGYGEDDTPDEGQQYVRVTVLVESQTTGDDTFSINVDHFVLQDEHGALTRGGNVRTAAQAEADEDAPGDAELATNEAIELALTFEIPAGVEPTTVFYLNDDRLFEIVDVDDAAGLTTL